MHGAIAAHVENGDTVSWITLSYVPKLRRVTISFCSVSFSFVNFDFVSYFVQFENLFFRPSAPAGPVAPGH